MEAAPIAAVAVLLLVMNRAAGTREEKARFLKPSDFYRGGVDWLPRADPALVAGLEKFFSAIHAAGGRAFISRNRAALGRTSGSKTSQHYTEPGRPFRAADVVVVGIEHRRAYNIARGLGVFSGIGAYPHWQQGPGLHLDVRPDRSPDNPATWAGLMVDGQQNTGFAIERAFA